MRDEFDELYGGGRQVLHRFLHEDQRVTTEPEVAIIAKLPGVVKVYVFGGSCSSPYDLSIKKASAYDWAELVPKIEQLLTERGERIERERLSGSDVEVPQ